MDLKFGSPSVVVGGKDLQSCQQALLKLDGNTVTHIEFQLCNIPDNLIPDFYETLHQTLSSFKCLNEISISEHSASQTSLQVKTILNTIVMLDNINIVILSLDGIPWECFCDMPEIWQGLFSKLLSLKVVFGDDYDNYSDESKSGLKKVLSWVATSVVVLTCGAHWDLYWDELSGGINFPRLRRLELIAIGVTETYLRTWFSHHMQVTYFDLCTYVQPCGENEYDMEIQVMTAADIVLMFREPMFGHIIRGRVRPEERDEDWGSDEVLIGINQVAQSSQAGLITAPKWRRSARALL